MGAWLIRAWMATLRIESHYEVPQSNPRTMPPQNYIYASFHENILLCAFICRNSNVSALVSNHADGELIAQIVHRLGFGLIRGSSNKGGAKALLEMVRKSKRAHLGITPDGPRGPRRKVQSGVAMLAAVTGLPVVPIGIEFSHCWRAKSWDRFAVPKPFSKAFVIFGAPIRTPASTDLSMVVGLRRQIEESLLAVVRRVEHWRDSGELLPEAPLQPIPVRKAG